ncbi:hypothetical protein APUTEX25_004307 [Auxenochlorella protothecoides]|uniref:G-patch domain-containing protein n=1 Tax=Auxenochlorella protothecoides TaxID=3075 RepID=A0A3M7L415_AUXPR|nr:hypothetical protein APUTEX25_004307 [Auxenochlorella protothecoides]|eukprot:RMZ57473.1 hypothetical protein APUTEX25_004307 [Auxenochlorella protothecoides]
MASEALEAELRQQLEETRAALAELADQDASPEIIHLRRELEAVAEDVEAALLQLAKDILLRRLDAAAAKTDATLRPGNRALFRHTDGRIHLGLVESGAGADGLIEVSFCHPCMPCQLQPLRLAATCLTAVAPAALAPPTAAGASVLVAPQPGCRLWSRGRIEAGASASGPGAVLVRAASSSDVTSDDSKEEGTGEGPVPVTNPLGLASWEAHTRGVAGRLMVAMGYGGAGLGKQGQGQTQPLQTVVLTQGAGLGVAAPARKRRSGRQARRAKAAAAAAARHEDAAAARHQVEMETGSVGLFAVLNSVLGGPAGDQVGGRGSDAQGREHGSHPAPTEDGARARAGTSPSAGPGLHAGEAARARRRAQAARLAALDSAEARVRGLEAAAARNARDPVMGPRARAALAEARQKLDEGRVAAARRSASAAAADSLHRDWAKF